MKSQLIKQVQEYYVLLKIGCTWAEQNGYYDREENDGMSFLELFDSEVEDVVNKTATMMPKTIELLAEAEDMALEDGFYSRGLSEKLACTFFQNLNLLVNYEEIDI